jgi:hypothetical protein
VQATFDIMAAFEAAFDAVMAKVAKSEAETGQGWPLMVAGVRQPEIL